MYQAPESGKRFCKLVYSFEPWLIELSHALNYSYTSAVRSFPSQMTTAEAELSSLSKQLTLSRSFSSQLLFLKTIHDTEWWMIAH